MVGRLNFIVTMQVILFSVFIFFLSGCADFELYVKNETPLIKPVMILIGTFDTRNMNYDPYVSDEFRDAIKFEFFRRGYNSITIAKSDTVAADLSLSVAKICKDNAGDILIKGVISQRESGFLAEREIDTLISFTIYRDSGEVIGECIYHDDESAGDESMRRSAADKFVSGLINSMNWDK